MKKILILILIFNSQLVLSQNIDINNDFKYDRIRTDILDGKLLSDYSFNIRPLNSNILSKSNLYNNYDYSLYSTSNVSIKFLGVDYFTEINTRHPYNRNNGSMIPNKGMQHIFSPGFYLRLGPLSIKIKPEHHYADNKLFDGFWEGHYPIIWSRRYRLWNHIDMPERFGSKRHNRLLLGQSNIKINWKKISFGFSNENIWWGPARRNSIMMSNHAQGFHHITFNTNEPIKTFLGKLEFQLITGKLKNSGYTPPRTDYEYAGTKLYVPKITQIGTTDDWRYLQGLIISYSPKWIDGFSIGFIRWVQMYSDLLKGRYWWMEGKPNYMPIFSNLFRKNDIYENYEAQTDQAAGIFFKWLWKESKAEIYAEFHHNDSKQNLRDLLLDSDHSRAATIGIQKVFEIKKSKYLFNWEWTQMEQNATRLVREAESWYQHAWVYDGYTNNGEVLGSSIGPGSNSHYLSINKIEMNQQIGIAFEVIDHDNDFYHRAFSDSNDFRRYWKDFNLHLKFNKKFNNFLLSSRLVYIRSLNYQWELRDTATTYYQPGKDTNNFHLNIKLTYFMRNML